MFAQIDIGSFSLLFIIIVVAIAIYLLSGFRIIYQYERGVKFSLGSFKKIYPPGLAYAFPAFQSIKKVDLRVNTLDIPRQEVITKDNVSCAINAVIFYRVVQADKAVIEISNYNYAINQLAQSSLRNVVGTAELDTVLAQRDQLGESIRKFVDEFTMPWGIHVLSVELKDVELKEDMKRSMAAQAEAERDRRARITLAEGEAMAADKLLEAAKTIEKSPAALQLRLYQAMVRIGEENNSVVVLPIPIEILSIFQKNKEWRKASANTLKTGLLVCFLVLDKKASDKSNLKFKSFLKLKRLLEANWPPFLKKMIVQLGVHQIENLIIISMFNYSYEIESRHPDCYGHNR